MFPEAVETMEPLLLIITLSLHDGTYFKSQLFGLFQSVLVVPTKVIAPPISSAPISGAFLKSPSMSYRIGTGEEGIIPFAWMRLSQFGRCKSAKAILVKVVAPQAVRADGCAMFSKLESKSNSKPF